MASIEPPWKRLRATTKPPTPPQPSPPPGRPKVTIKPVVDLVEETVMWPEDGVPEIALDACCKHYRDLTKSTEKVNLTLSRRGATEVLGEAAVESPAEPSRDDGDAKDPDAVPTILCTLRRDRDPRSIITSETGDSVVAVDPQYSGTYGHLRERRAASSTGVSGEDQPQQADSTRASVSESDSGRDVVTPMERNEGDQRSVRSPSPVRSPSQMASAPWVRAAAAAAASFAWFGKGKGMHPPPFMAPAFARMAAMNRMRAAQGYTDQRGEGQRVEQMPENVEYNGQRRTNVAQMAVPMDQSDRGMPQTTQMPGLQYQPPRPATQGVTEGFMPSYEGGPYQIGAMPPSEPPMPYLNQPQQIPGLPPQQPPMPPWAARGQYGPPPPPGGGYR